MEHSNNTQNYRHGHRCHIRPIKKLSCEICLGLAGNFLVNFYKSGSISLQPENLKFPPYNMKLMEKHRVKCIDKERYYVEI